jgi:predicted esterase
MVARMRRIGEDGGIRRRPPFFESVADCRRLRVAKWLAVFAVALALGQSWERSGASPRGAWLGSPTAAAAERVGHSPSVRVSAPTRLDWVFAVSNQSPAEPPADWLPGYEATAQTYERYVPAGLGRTASPGLILFVSAGPRPQGLEAFRKTCDERLLVFVSPHNAGNGVDGRQRIRIILDCLDDVRREYGIDPDRTYIAGFSGGGRIACGVGFSLPEQFGGVIPVCAAGDLREETWLRQRVIDRLSVAHLTGDGDFNRGEVERFRGAMLAGVGVRTKVWVAPRTGHVIPRSEFADQAVAWLDEGLKARRELARAYPAIRAPAKADGPPADRETVAASLLAEAKQRLERPATAYSGLMLAKGVLERWPDLPAAREARTLLARAEEGGVPGWEEADVAHQRKFLIARARGVSDYASGELPPQYAPQRPAMARAAVELWNLVIEDGQDREAVVEARRRLPELEKLAAP